MLGNRRFHTKIRKFQKNLEIFLLKYKSLFSLTALWSHSIESKFLVWSPKAVSEWLVSPGLISPSPWSPPAWRSKGCHWTNAYTLWLELHTYVKLSWEIFISRKSHAGEEERAEHARWNCRVCSSLSLYCLPVQQAFGSEFLLEGTEGPDRIHQEKSRRL